MNLLRVPVPQCWLWATLLHWIPSYSASAEELSLNNLIEIARVTIATKTERSIESAPSSVTVITHDDIKRYMCRDLVDVLNLVPGFSISKDLGWDMALASRGIFAFEGRALFMVNGMQVTGLYFGNYILGNDIPVHMIDRIEVIRGPGSVIYGGSAELAVINVITRSDKNTAGTQVFARYGQLEKDAGHRDIGVRYDSDPANADFKYSLSAFAGDAVWSNKEYRFFDYAPERNADKDKQSIRDAYTTMGSLNIGKTQAKFYARKNTTVTTEDKYSDTDGYTEKLGNFKHDEHNFYLEHAFQIGENFSLTPFLDYQYSMEWQYPNESVRAITRNKAGLSALYHSDSIEILTGAEYFVDDARMIRNKNDPDDSIKGFYKNRNDPILHDNLQIASQALYSGLTYFWNNYSASAGIRYDSNEVYGHATSPRLGLTASIDKFHSKLIYSEAFRAPTTGNNTYSYYGIDPAKPWREDVIPETVQVAELELGYKISPAFKIVSNVYQQTIRKVIEFYYDIDNDDTYSRNGGKMGSQGIELENSYLSTDFDAKLSLSYSKLTDKTAVTYIARHRDAVMGVPDSKASLHLSRKLTPALRANVNQLFVGKIATMAVKNCESESDTTCTHDTKVQNVTDVGVQYNEPGSTLELALNIQDAFNQGLLVATGYLDSGADDFKWKGREVSLNTSYKF